MASLSKSTLDRSPAEPSDAVGGLAFDWAMALLSGWVLFGLYLDGWAHTHIASTLETFFTPWHGVLYTGLLASLGFLAITLLRNRARRHPFASALPAGYNLSLIGGLIFAFAGGADMLWHRIFGIEVGTEALLSPTHLMLAVGGALLMTGPLRAYWTRSDAPRNWSEWLPLLISLVCLFSVMTFFSQYIHPVRTAWSALSEQTATPREGWAIGVGGTVFQAALMSAIVLLALRRWPTLPPGSVLLMLTTNIALMSTQDDQYRFIPAAAAAGLIGDVFLWRLHASKERLTLLRSFAMIIPTAFFAGYYLTILLGEGTWWSIHLWLGSIFIAGMAGWLVSYLVFPPTSPNH